MTVAICLHVSYLRKKKEVSHFQEEVEISAGQKRVQISARISAGNDKPGKVEKCYFIELLELQRANSECY